MTALAIRSAGMVTGVGLSAPAACAAIRVGLSSFEETRFMFDGEWLVASAVPLERPWRGREKLLQMLIPALRECLESVWSAPQIPPILLCLSERARPGRFANLEDGFLDEIGRRLQRPLHVDSAIIAGGRVGGVQAIEQARGLVARSGACVVAGVDTFLVAPTLTAYVEQRLVRTADNADGFFPGEAAAAVLLERAAGDDALCIYGLGYGQETALPDGDEPLRADGLTEAIRASLSDGGIGYESLDYRLTDISGGQYFFKEAALALLRTMRVRKEAFTLWHPADCIGEIGAATVPCVLAVADAAYRKRYAPGPGVLCHFSNDDGLRGVLTLRGETNEWV